MSWKEEWVERRDQRRNIPHHILNRREKPLLSPNLHGKYLRMQKYMSDLHNPRGSAWKIMETCICVWYVVGTTYLIMMFLALSGLEDQHVHWTYNELKGRYAFTQSLIQFSLKRFIFFSSWVGSYESLLYVDVHDDNTHLFCLYLFGHALVWEL